VLDLGGGQWTSVIGHSRSNASDGTRLAKKGGHHGSHTDFRLLLAHVFCSFWRFGGGGSWSGGNTHFARKAHLTVAPRRRGTDLAFSTNLFLLYLGVSVIMIYRVTVQRPSSFQLRFQPTLSYRTGYSDLAGALRFTPFRYVPKSRLGRPA